MSETRCRICGCDLNTGGLCPQAYLHKPVASPQATRKIGISQGNENPSCTCGHTKFWHANFGKANCDQCSCQKFVDACAAQPVAGTTSQKGENMDYEVLQDKKYPQDWRAEAIGAEGECFVTIFSGPDAELRAREYAAWQSKVRV